MCLCAEYSYTLSICILFFIFFFSLTLSDPVSQSDCYFLSSVSLSLFSLISTSTMDKPNICGCDITWIPFSFWVYTHSFHCTRCFPSNYSFSSVLPICSFRLTFGVFFVVVLFCFCHFVANMFWFSASRNRSHVYIKSHRIKMFESKWLKRHTNT